MDLSHFDVRRLPRLAHINRRTHTCGELHLGKDGRKEGEGGEEGGKGEERKKERHEGRRMRRNERK